jgi:hypothetical protein
MDPRVKPAGDDLGLSRSNLSHVIAGLDPAIHHLGDKALQVGESTK